MPEFLTQWNHPSPEPSLKQEDLGESLCESLGYRGVKEQVEAFTVSGARLDAFRSGYYDEDFVSDGEDIMDIEMPIGREPYTDFSDVQSQVNAFSESYQARTRAAQLERDKKIAQDASELERLRSEAKVRLTSRTPSSTPVGNDTPEKTLQGGDGVH
jgi:hypothetical protein